MNFWTIMIIAAVLVIVLVAVFFHFNHQAWFAFQQWWALFYNWWMDNKFFTRPVAPSL